MTEYLDIIQWKKTRNGKNQAIRLGYAKESAQGKMYLTFDALPIPQKNRDGEYDVTLVLEQRRERGERPAPPQDAPATDSEDDSIPF